MKNTGSSFEIVFEKTIKVLIKGNFLYLRAISAIESVIFVSILNIDCLMKIKEEIAFPDMYAVANERAEGLIEPKTIIKI